VQFVQRLKNLGRGKALSPALTKPEEFALHFAWSNQTHMREQLAEVDSEQLLLDP
jgi:hypothetical protein